MKKLLLITLLSVLGFTVHSQYYQLRYDSVGIRSKLILSTVVTGALTDSLLTKKANGGVYKISQASLQQLIATGTNSQFYRGDKTFQTFGTIWGQTYNGTNNIVGALTSVTSVDMTGKLSLSNTPTTNNNIALEVSQIGSVVNQTYIGQKITTKNTEATSGGAATGMVIDVSTAGAGVYSANGLILTVQANNRGSGSTFTNEYGVYSKITGSTANISTAINQQTIAVRGEAINNTAIGQVGNTTGGYFTANSVASNTAFGVYTSATGGTNSWGVYSVAGKNFFNGNTLIGTNVDNGEKLQVLGKATVSAAPTNATDVVRKTELDLKANLASPTFTGTPLSTTPSAGTNTNQISTAAFVQQEILADRIVNTTTTALSSVDLNTQYPSVKVGYRVICHLITGAPAIYTKATEDGSSDVWLTTTAIVTP